MIRLEVTGMTCGGRVRAVEAVITAADRAATVDPASGRGDADTSASAPEFVRAIEAAGGGAKLRTEPV
jgi:hypothetical protein